jgi:LysR family transcriptional regulator, transcriptional activator of the cysJI operon
MDLYYLETYIEAVKLGSISKAARKLYLSQPAVSLQIQKLEQELGFRLINRDRNSFAVTREGKRFFRFAEYVQQQHKNLLYELNQMQRVTGNLIIVSNSIIGEVFLPPALAEFKKINPSIEYKLLIVDSYKVIEELYKGTNTVGFCGVLPNDPGFEVIKIGKDEIVAVVYPGHPFSNQKEIGAADLMGETLILHSEPTGRRPTFANALLKVGIDLEKYQPKLILGTTTGVISAVEAQSGIALISSLAIKNSGVVVRIKVFKIKNLELKRDLYCVYRKVEMTDSSTKDFVTFIRDYASRQTDL